MSPDTHYNTLPPDSSESMPQALAFDTIPNLSSDHVDSPIFPFDINAATASMTVSISKFNMPTISSGYRHPGGT